ncbi:MAG: CpsB/CapC family capsule biosynthesis tyrosine phosphatase [Polyangiales bacterium]
MKGYVDLHSHYVPAIDDGVRTDADGVALLQGLHAIGFDRVVATPHIRTAMFENRRAGLEAAFDAFLGRNADATDLPATGLGAEHFFDDVVWELFLAGELRPYPGDKAVLVEFPERMFPMGIDARFFKMQVRGLRPVLAHPERYMPLASSSEPLAALVNAGVLPLLDVMSLVGKYGRQAERAGHRILEEGLYAAACTDVHRPGDVETVEKALVHLESLVGEEGVRRLFVEGPTRILEGTAP